MAKGEGRMGKDLEMKPKLSMLRRIVECGEESSCADVKAKRERRVYC